MIFSESIAPDCVLEWTDADLDAGDDVAVCDACGRPATVVHRVPGLPELPLCAACDAETA